MALPVLVINRDRDTERWAATLAAAREVGVEPERVPAIDAHAPGFRLEDHADLLRGHFWGRRTIKPGAVGCYLSHRQAWARVVGAGWDAALILEDDADLLEPPDRAAAAELDLLFANDRMADWTGANDGVVTVEQAVARVGAGGGPKAMGLRQAPGADAYVVSRDGARRLLALTADLGIVCGVDWAMIWLSLPHPVSGIGELSVLAGREPPADRPLRSGILCRPVARLRGGPSVLGHAVEVPLPG